MSNLNCLDATRCEALIQFFSRINHPFRLNTEGIADLCEDIGITRSKLDKLIVALVEQGKLSLKIEAGTIKVLTTGADRLDGC